MLPSEKIPFAFRRLIGLMWLSFGRTPPPEFHPAAFSSGVTANLQLTQLAATSGMLPWLLGHLDTIDKHLEPDTVAAWHQQHLKNRLRVLVNTSWTLRLCSALRSANIACLPIKGICAAMRYYGSIDGRACGDIDLMVVAADLDEARRIFLSFGLEPLFPSRSLNRAEARWVSRSMHHFTFFEPESGLLIELHWALHDNALLDNEDRDWPNFARETIIIGDHPLPALDRPRDYLLLLTHTARSGWAKMKWVLDVWLAWASLSADQRASVECRIRDLKLEPTQGIFLRLARCLFGMGSDEPMPAIPGELRLMFDPNDRHSVARKCLNVRNHYRLRNDKAYRVDVVRLYLLSWSDMRLLKLPSWAFPLYIPLRIPMFIYRKLIQRPKQ